MQHLKQPDIWIDDTKVSRALSVEEMRQRLHVVAPHRAAEPPTSDDRRPRIVWRRGEAEM